MEFSKTLIHWYLQNKRDLPWRKNTNPYAIWLSEIILQQTRVAQGTPYFLRFIEAFPTVQSLAAASEQDVLKLWQGLGYYSRARNLHATAKYIAHELNGNFPNTHARLLQLKGVGDYTAAAIASIAYNEDVPVVDGNVYRVLARYYGIETDIASSPAKKQFTQLAADILPKGQAADFNQAMMEFGALQCTPKNPNCMFCIFNSQCVAYLTGKVNELPVKLKKQKITNRYFNYLIIKDGAGNTILQKRTAKGIWHNLYEFPLLETETDTPVKETAALIKNYEAMSFTPKSITLLTPNAITHKLSHQHLYIRFWEVTTDEILPEGITPKDAISYPFPIVIYNFIEKLWQ